MSAEVTQRLAKRDRLVRGGEVRLGDDLQQRRAGTVEVDVAAGGKGRVGVAELQVRGQLVQQLARVFLEVGAGDADGRTRRGSLLGVNVGVGVGVGGER